MAVRLIISICKASLEWVEPRADVFSEGFVIVDDIDVRVDIKDERVEPLNCRTKARANRLNLTLSVERSR